MLPGLPTLDIACAHVRSGVCPYVTGPLTEHGILIPRYPFFIPFFCLSSTPLFGEHVVFLSWAFALVPTSGCSEQFCCDSVWMYIFSSLRVPRSGFSGSCGVRNQLTICCAISHSCLPCAEGFITPSSPLGSPPPDTAAFLNAAILAHVSCCGYVHVSFSAGRWCLFPSHVCY